jgi:hypothetical protein
MSTRWLKSLTGKLKMVLTGEVSSDLNASKPDNYRLVSDLERKSLLTGDLDPYGYFLIGREEFVLGRITGLVLNTKNDEIVYLIINMAYSNFETHKRQEKILPLTWVDLNPRRQQAIINQVSPDMFLVLPTYQSEMMIPQEIPFPARDYPDADDWLYSA